MVRIKNLKRRMRSFNLEHPTFTKAVGSNGQGKPESLTLLALQIKEVHEDVLKCVEIRNALAPKNGRPTLRVI